MSDVNDSVLTSATTTVMVCEAGSWNATESVANSNTGKNCSVLTCSGNADTIKGNPGTAESMQRHLETGNYCFADGHVKSLRLEKLYASGTSLSVSGSNPTLNMQAVNATADSE